MTSNSNTLQPPWWNPRAQTRKQSSGQWILCIRGFQNHSRSASFQDPLFSAKKRSASHGPSLFFPMPPPPPPTQKDAIFSKTLAPVLQAKILTRNTFIAKPHEAVRASSMNLESRIQYCFGHLRGFAGKSLRSGDRPLICHVVKTRVRDGTHWQIFFYLLSVHNCPAAPPPVKKIKGGGNSILKLSQKPTGHPREKL